MGKQVREAPQADPRLFSVGIVVLLLKWDGESAGELARIVFSFLDVQNDSPESLVWFRQTLFRISDEPLHNLSAGILIKEPMQLVAISELQCALDD